MKQKRIIAFILSATLVLGSCLTAGATELEESQSLSDQELEADTMAYYTEDELEESDDEISETDEAAAEIEEIAEDIEIIEDDEIEQEVELNEDDVAVFDTSDMDVGRFTGMKEIAEIDPDLIEGFGEESDSGIQTYSFKSYSYSYTYTSLSFSSSGGRSADAILDMAVTLINGNEGGYNTVTKNDNNSGAMSIGKIQWWASSALLLARLIVAEDNQTAYNLLGDSLYNEIIDSSTSWSKRTLDDSEAEKMKNFLDPNQNPASKTIQDKLANSYVASYINHGYKLGIRNAAALVYYADIENQYGETGGSMGAARACANYAYNIAGSWDTVTLNELHLAAVSNVAHNYAARSNVGAYVERRRYTYGQLVSAGWTYCNSGDYTIPYDTNGYAGAAWLQRALNYYTNAGLSVTGNYDDALKAAVKKYQQSVGLSADGLAGRHTSTKLIHDMYYNSMQTYGASFSVTTNVTDIVKIDGVWTYTVNGEPDYTHTGVDKNVNGWYYVKNGVVDFSYNGFATNSNGKWYIENGKVTFNKNSVIKDTTGAIGSKGTWWYVVGSKVQTDFTGLADYSNENGWWYIENGKVTFTKDTIAKNKNGWYYVKDSKVDFSFTGLADFSNEYGWWYCENGKVTFKKDTIAKNKNGWYYIKDSKVDFSFTGLADFSNENGWWYCEKGKVTFKKDTIAKNKNGWYYVKDSKVDFSFTGLADFPNENGWWYCQNGKVNFNFTGIAQNKNGWYYVKDSKVDFSFTGTVTANGTKYSVKNGKVDR